MDKNFKFIGDLIAIGGPVREHYREADEWIRQFYQALDAGELSQNALKTIRQVMAPVLVPATMFGWAYWKPRGYAGDFEIIERHYLNYICPAPHLSNWDRYWQDGSASSAVRNRKTYFVELLCAQADRATKPLKVLNLACGPARDVMEFFFQNQSDVHFDCIDFDGGAIKYGRKLCRAFSHRIRFIRENVVRFHPRQTYDLIWSAGLFDYFNDRLFKTILRRLLETLAPGGEIVIGNFSTSNPNIGWLRFCEWTLQHRSPDQLRALAMEVGADPDLVEIGEEPEGVNLFLHIRRP